MKTITFILVISSTALFSCKNTSKAMDSNSTTPTKTEENRVASKDMVYDVILSFISKASGIDHAIKDKIDQAIAASNKKYKTNIKPEVVHWGREGEIDYLFMTKNLSTKQIKELNAQIKAAIGDLDMVHVAYNQKSVHKR